MPYSFNGIGTRLYGKRDFRPDGSYVTTEWAAILWIPALPLKSMRIHETAGTDVGVFSNLKYVILEQTPYLHKKQVLCVYSFAAAVVACFLLGLAYLDYGNEFLVWVAVALLAMIPYALRRRARNNALVGGQGRPVPIIQ
jgi:hypothetical protein